jgi:mannan endo-1,4-beta-mannosidase
MIKYRYNTKYLLTGLLLLLSAYAFPQQKNDYVVVKGNRFFINNIPYYYIGTNYWYGGFLSNQSAGQKRVAAELDLLQQKGINNLRVLACVEGTGQINGVMRVEQPLQTGKGVFNENVLKGLDFLLAEMGKRNMKAVLYLGNNWEWSGGFLQYLNWNGEISDSVMHRKLNWDEMRDYVSKFYQCESCKKQYRQQVSLIVNRVNTISGKKYSNDNAIMAWELANEPRPMRPAANPFYVQWISEAAAFIKSIDSHHLVTTGCEGEMGTESMDVFKTIHQDKNIDYATIHIWPKNWRWFSDTAIGKDIDAINSKTISYIDKHAAAAKTFGKPLVIEEFGLPRDGHSFSLSATTMFRDAYYKTIFDKLLTSAQQQEVIAGCNFWALGGTGRPSGKQLFWQHGEDVIGDPPMEEQGLNAVFDTDASTWKIIESFVIQIKKANGIVSSK